MSGLTGPIVALQEPLASFSIRTGAFSDCTLSLTSCAFGALNRKTTVLSGLTWGDLPKPPEGWLYAGTLVRIAAPTRSGRRTDFISIIMLALNFLIFFYFEMNLEFFNQSNKGDIHSSVGLPK